MAGVANNVRRFLTSDDGVTAVEYAAMLALLLFICFTAITILGNNTGASFTSSANSAAS
jgi:pilus assembly protein Flp/PilA